MSQSLFNFVRPTNDWTPEEPPQLQPGEPVGLDFEYRPGRYPSGDRPFSLAVYSHARQRGWYLPWGHEGGGNLPLETVKRWYSTELRGRDVYCLNAKAEVHQTHNMGIEPDSMDMRPHDVAFNAGLLNENRYSGFSLAALCEEYLPPEERKVQADALDPATFYLGHAGEVANRCISDARQAFLIHEATVEKIKAEGLERVLDLENQNILATVEMERNGALVDRPKLERWSALLDEKISQLFMETYSETGLPCNPNKPKEMTRLFQQLGLDKPSVYNEDVHSYEQSWAEEALDSVDHPIVRRVASLRKYLSLKSKYIDKYLNALDGNNILHYQLHQLRGDEHGTVTGRYSCGGGKLSANIQQVPKAELQLEEMGDGFIIRELFIPEAGRTMGATDASQIEFRLFGHYSKSDDIISAYANDPNIDFHLMVTKMMKPHLTDPKELKRERKHMKHNNFGVIYGMGRQKLARKLGLPCYCQVNWYERDDNNRMVRYFSDNRFHDKDCKAREANKIMDEYKKKFSAAGELLKKASSTAEQRGYVHTILGRRRRYPDGRRLHSALNAIIQGGAADLFKMKQLQIYRQRKALGIKMRMPVHDELVYDCDLDRLDDIEACFAEQLLDLSIPILWDTGTGSNWREANGQ